MGLTGRTLVPTAHFTSPYESSSGMHARETGVFRTAAETTTYAYAILQAEEERTNQIVSILIPLIPADGALAGPL